MPAAGSYVSGARAMHDIEAIVQRVRWMTWPAILDGANEMARRLCEVPGLTQVKVESFAADGKTFHGGWVMPKGWEVRQGTLTVASGAGKGKVLADYRKNPWSLIMWSPPTKGVMEAGVVAVAGKDDAANVAGKFVLAADLGALGVDMLTWAAGRGAVGLITDDIRRVPKIKDGAELDRAVQYWNYVNPQWDGSPRLPAFGLAPSMGKRVRALLAAEPGLRLTANVDSRLTYGELPLVSAFLPGRAAKEIVITAHMDEPGASDNASGTALAMETMRTLAMFVKARGRKLKYGVRLLASTEVRGIQALINTRAYGRDVLCGMNLDMLGYEHLAGKTTLEVITARPGGASVLEFLLRELALKEAKRPPLFRVKVGRQIVVNDCHFAAAPFEVPMVLLEQAPDRTYHSSLDVPANLSEAHLKRMGRIIATAARFMADGDADEFAALCQRAYRSAMQRMRRSQAQGAQLAVDVRDIWRDASRFLVPAARRDLAQRTALWDRKLPPAAPLIRDGMQPEPDAKLLAAAAALVITKTFKGYIGFENLRGPRRQKLIDIIGDLGWGRPTWLQWALALADGKRSVLDIHSRMIRDGAEIELRTLLGAIRLLNQWGMVRGSD